MTCAQRADKAHCRRMSKQFHRSTTQCIVLYRFFMCNAREQCIQVAAHSLVPRPTHRLIHSASSRQARPGHPFVPPSVDRCRRGLTLSEGGLNLSRVLNPGTGCVAKVGRWAVGDSEGGGPAVPAAGLGAHAQPLPLIHRGQRSWADGPLHARVQRLPSFRLTHSVRLPGEATHFKALADWQGNRLHAGSAANVSNVVPKPMREDVVCHDHRTRSQAKHVREPDVVLLLAVDQHELKTLVL